MKYIWGVLGAIILLIGAYFLGKSQSDVLEPESFTISSQISPEQELGVARSDVFTVAEVCHSGKWFVFKGQGRIFLTGMNTFHYTVVWDPETDIVASDVPEKSGAFDLEIIVNDVGVRMEKPDIRGFIIDKSAFVNDEAEKANLQLAMIDRLDREARNKLSTEAGKTRLINAIRSTIYNIYSTESEEIRNIKVTFSEDALPEYISPKFEEECESKAIPVFAKVVDNNLSDDPQTTKGTDSEVINQTLKETFTDDEFNLHIHEWVE